jgi:hypothetical protein
MRGTENLKFIDKCVLHGVTSEKRKEEPYQLGQIFSLSESQMTKLYTNGFC